MTVVEFRLASLTVMEKCSRYHVRKRREDKSDGSDTVYQMGSGTFPVAPEERCHPTLAAKVTKIQKRSACSSFEQHYHLL